VERNVFRAFWASSARTVATAAVNMGTTIIIVRLFGAEPYANQILDLAKLSLLLILIELIPSSFAIYKIQDSIAWRSAFAVQSLAVAALLTGAVLSLQMTTQVFATGTLFIALYALTLVAKRYADILLQAQNQIKTLYLLDLIAAVGRLGLIVALYLMGTSADLAIWASLALASLFAQTIGLFHVIPYSAPRAEIWRGAWRDEVWVDRGQMAKYYPGIVLKRLRDNIIPLLAERVFGTEKTLAEFLLAFRGISFGVGLAQVFESLVNNRQTLQLITHRKMFYVGVISVIAYGASLVSATILMAASGLSTSTGLFVAVLATLCFPATYNIVQRAEQFSKFKVMWVNLSMASYCLTMFAGGWCLIIFGWNSPLAFSALVSGAHTIQAAILSLRKEEP
jgi:hypothetical protein